MGTLPFRSGFVALLGRPNCGKSTLLNTILGEEISPATPLPQTTRQRLRGVYTRDTIQIVFVDTPGIHKGAHRLNDSMLGEAKDAAAEEGIDCLCYLVDLSREFGEEETLAAAIVANTRAPRLIVFNKADICTDLRETIGRFFARFPDLKETPAVTISATRKSDGQLFLAALDPFIKEGPRYYDEETLTDASMRFFAAEFIRKHIILGTRDEVPHAVFVEIESYKELPQRHEISAVIHVETIGQKGIVIGRGGALINRIRAGAEKDLRIMAGCPVKVSCHIKVTPHWRDDPRFLKSEFLRRN
jgi:GTP-binding protein Era